MSRSVLHRIAIGHGWKPEEWHFQLADRIGANPVLMIFRHAAVSASRNGKDLAFSDRQAMIAARAYTADVEKVFGCPCDMKAPPMRAAPRDVMQDNWRIR